MCCGNYWKRIVSFALALMVGVLIAGFFQKIAYRNEITVAPTHVIEVVPAIKPVACSKKSIDVSEGTNSLQIISKPTPSYTDAARQSQTQGKVSLRVTFLASGQIGSISPVNTLPNGLTEQAIAAALNIRFKPATKDGEPVTVTKTVEYSFTIY